MQFLFAFVFLASRASGHDRMITFQEVVCRHCSALNRPHSSAELRVGKAGPRGIPGLRGPPGTINETAIREIVREEIEIAVGYLSVKNCQGISMQSAKRRNETGGVFDIYIPGLGRTEVYCDVSTDGGDWIVFQRRMDGSVDFYRDWADYVNGFGNLTGEFWLGLEAMYKLTSAGPCELRIDMIDRNNEHHYAAFSNFEIRPASDKYRMRVTRYSGNATDSFGDPPGSTGDHNNQRFSTKDQDNDSGSRNCARERKGGWWYNQCQHSNLNGLYDDVSGWNGVVWMQQRRHKPMYMKFTEMKFRLKR